MKKIFSSIILLIAGAVLLSSNSQAQGVTITKRHYNHGFYVDFGSKKKTEAKTIAAQAEKQNIVSADAQSINSIPSVKDNAPEQLPLVPVNNVPVKKQSTSKHIGKNNDIAAKPSNTELGNSNNNDVIMPANASDDFNASVNSATSSNDSGINTVLLVIITILIPFLGVGLAKGVHGEFWLDLLLTLLFYIPGLIYGLIVVLS